MSHFTRVHTQLRNINTVQRALEDLGYSVEPNATVRGYRGNEAKADLVVRMDGNYDLGFSKNGDQQISLLADFWGLKISQQDFLNEVTQRYAYFTVIEQAEAQGFNVTSEENQQDGSIRLVVQRWG